jgi:transcriptional antiterminator
MTLEELKFKHIHYTLIKNGYIRASTAKELGVSDRSLRSYLKQMKALGYVVDKDEKEEVNEYTVSNYIMPTNEQRVNYIDWLINADFLNSYSTRHQR